MLTETEIRLNRLAQGYSLLVDGVAWFGLLGRDDQREVLRVLGQLCVQVHPRAPEVDLAIEQAQLKPSFTPCVLLRGAARPERAIVQILSLPPVEWTKSFALLASLFSVADTRRRKTTCKDGCTHEWHNL
jgi:hypothetical protein